MDRIGVSERERLEIVTHSVVALIALFVVTNVLNYLIDTPESAGFFWQNVLAIAILAGVLVVPARLRPAVHFGVFLVLSVAQIATDLITEGQGHLLFVVTVLLCHAYGFMRRRPRLWFVVLFGLWLGALTFSGLEYIYLPLSRSGDEGAIRALRAAAFAALYLCTAWQFYVVWVRPTRRLQARYKEVTKKRIVSTPPDQGVVEAHPIEKVLAILREQLAAGHVDDRLVERTIAELEHHKRELSNAEKETGALIERLSLSEEDPGGSAAV